MVRTRRFHCYGLRFNPWSGNEDPISHKLQPRKPKTMKEKMLNFSIHQGNAKENHNTTHYALTGMAKIKDSFGEDAAQAELILLAKVHL